MKKVLTVAISLIILFATLNLFAAEAYVENRYGTVGTKIYIYGSDFGKGKGTVVIDDEKLYILSWEESMIIAKYVHAPKHGIGTYDITITTGNGIEQVINDGFTIYLPYLNFIHANRGSIDCFSSASLTVSQGEVLIIDGMFFGSAKAKPRFYLKKDYYTIIDLADNAFFDDWTGESYSTLTIPEYLEPGTYTLQIRNFIGWSRAVTLEVQTQ